MSASRAGFINKKMELFCRFVAKGSTYTEAYELSGYAPSSSNASNLAARPEIKARIAELKEEFINEQALMEAALARARAQDAANGDPSLTETRQVAEWSINRVLDMIADNVRLAQVANEFRAANDGLKMLGEAMGMFGKDKATPPANPLTFIGQLNQHLPPADGEEPVMLPAQRNPLAPAAD
jgi:hypothetical protein